MVERVVTAEVVKALLDYDGDTGTLTWKFRGREWFPTALSQHTFNTRFAGKEAGRVNPSNGYHETSLFYRLYKSHRLIWLWMTGAWPEDFIDHINHDKGDNRWANLRAATKDENVKNVPLRADNITGIPGVSQYPKSGKWYSRIKSGGRVIHLGQFDSFEKAVIARKAAEMALGFHPNHGSPKRSSNG